VLWIGIDPDRHQINADPHVDPTLNFTHIGKSERLFHLISQQCQFTLFFLSRHRHNFHYFHNFQYFGQYFGNLLKKSGIGIETDPDPAK
jgi:hypothetical protein